MGLAQEEKNGMWFACCRCMHQKKFWPCAIAGHSQSDDSRQTVQPA